MYVDLAAAHRRWHPGDPLSFSLRRPFSVALPSSAPLSALTLSAFLSLSLSLSTSFSVLSSVASPFSPSQTRDNPQWEPPAPLLSTAPRVVISLWLHRSPSSPYFSSGETGTTLAGSFAGWLVACLANLPRKAGKENGLRGRAERPRQRRRRGDERRLETDLRGRCSWKIDK